MKVGVVDTWEPFLLHISEIIDFADRHGAEPSSELWENAEVPCKSNYKLIEFGAPMKAIPLSFVLNLKTVYAFLLYSHWIMSCASLLSGVSYSLHLCGFP